jgi:hypothetical protein
MADVDTSGIENLLREAIGELRKINDNLERIRGVSRFSADLHDLKSVLDEISANTNR